jgi:hypothetical protein
MKTKHHMTQKNTSTSALPGTSPMPTGEVHLPVPVPGKPVIDPGMRREMIAIAAYYRAEKRRFSGGSELEDWLEAEAEIDRTLGGFAAQYH